MPIFFLLQRTWEWDTHFVLKRTPSQFQHKEVCFPTFNISHRVASDLSTNFTIMLILGIIAWKPRHTQHYSTIAFGSRDGAHVHHANRHQPIVSRWEILLSQWRSIGNRFNARISHQPQQQQLDQIGLSDGWCEESRYACPFQGGGKPLTLARPDFVTQWCPYIAYNRYWTSIA